MSTVYLSERQEMDLDVKTLDEIIAMQQHLRRKIAIQTKMMQEITETISERKTTQQDVVHVDVKKSISM